MQIENDCPAMHGLSAIADWRPHGRCWMLWPTRAALWGDELTRARSFFASFARAVSEYEPVTMIASPTDLAEARLACGRDVAIHEAPIDDDWARDVLPLFVGADSGDKISEIAAVDWQFNGWGNRFPHHDQSDRVGEAVIASLDCRRFIAPMFLEGGGISTNGAGSVLASEQCAPNENRNPTLTLQQIEERLALFLGVRNIIWIDCGSTKPFADLSGVARFASPNQVFVNSATDRGDIRESSFRDARRRIREASTPGSSDFEIIEMPSPPSADGDGFSYLDYCIINGAVFAPAYGVPQDDSAVKILSTAYPDRKVQQVDASVLQAVGFGLSRMTQHSPNGEMLPAGD
jgi:agmatine deiminase